MRGTIFINSQPAIMCDGANVGAVSTVRPQAESYFVEQGIVFIYKLADVPLNTAANSCWRRLVHVVRVGGRCPSAHKSAAGLSGEAPPLAGL